MNAVYCFGWPKFDYIISSTLEIMCCLTNSLSMHLSTCKLKFYPLSCVWHVDYHFNCSQSKIAANDASDKNRDRWWLPGWYPNSYHKVSDNKNIILLLL